MSKHIPWPQGVERHAFLLRLWPRQNLCTAYPSFIRQAPAQSSPVVFLLDSHVFVIYVPPLGPWGDIESARNSLLVEMCEPFCFPFPVLDASPAGSGDLTKPQALQLAMAELFLHSCSDQRQRVLRPFRGRTSLTCLLVPSCLLPHQRWTLKCTSCQCFPERPWSAKVAVPTLAASRDESCKVTAQLL